MDAYDNKDQRKQCACCVLQGCNDGIVRELRPRTTEDQGGRGGGNDQGKCADGQGDLVIVLRPAGARAQVLLVCVCVCNLCNIYAYVCVSIYVYIYKCVYVYM